MVDGITDEFIQKAREKMMIDKLASSFKRALSFGGAKKGGILGNLLKVKS